MQCPCCEVTRRELYCAACLKEGSHASVIRDLGNQVGKARGHAQQLLSGPIRNPDGGRVKGAREWRKLRAGVAKAEARCAALRAQIARTTEQAQNSHSSSSTAEVAHRRALLDAATRSLPTLSDVNAQIQDVRQQQREIGKRIIQARRVLVREAVDVFGVQRNRAWEIAGIELPAPEHFRLHASAMINAAFVHTAHLLSLLTRYLSISVPFLVAWPPPLELAHVGRPALVPNLPLVSTTKFRDKTPPRLWMSSTAPVLAKSRRGGVVPIKGTALADVVRNSYKKHQTTLTAFALLAHSVAYLAYTQGVPGIGITPGSGSRRDSDDDGDDDDSYPAASGALVPPTNVLELIALTAESPDLGVRAHEPGTTQTMRHLGFGLDVAKVVDSVLAAEDARWGRKHTDGRRHSKSAPDDREELSEGWDLLDAED